MCEATQYYWSKLACLLIQFCKSSECAVPMTCCCPQICSLIKHDENQIFLKWGRVLDASQILSESNHITCCSWKTSLFHHTIGHTIWIKTTQLQNINQILAAVAAENSAHWNFLFLRLCNPDCLPVWDPSNDDDFRCEWSSISFMIWARGNLCKTPLYWHQ